MRRTRFGVPRCGWSKVRVIALLLCVLAASSAYAQDPTLGVGGYEVTQAIQNPNSRVGLVAHRATAVRVTVSVQGSAQPVPNVTGRLHGSRDGQPLPDSPIAPVNPNGSITAPVTPDRGQLNSTLNFILPRSWTAAGAVTLAAEVNETRGADETVTFIAVPQVEIVIVPVAYQKNGQGQILRPTLDASNNFGLGNLRRILPLADVKITHHAEHLFTGDFAQNNAWDVLADQLKALRDKAYPGNDRPWPVYYGVVSPEVVAGLESFTAGIGFVGQPANRSFAPAGAGLANIVSVAAHEIGHNWGRGHAPCGTAGEPGYPYPDAAIGHLGTEIADSQLILHPATVKDVMSYCQPIWVSDYTYAALLSILTTPAPTPTPDPTEEPGSKGRAAQPGLLISGAIAADGQSGELDYAEPVMAERLVSGPGSGAYRIEMRDAEGALLFSYAFTPFRLDRHDQHLPPMDFAFAAPNPPTLATIELLRGTTVLAQLEAASGPPTVEARIIPSGDPTLVEIRWTASDPDGNPVEVDARYSPDNGQTWQWIEVEDFGDDTLLVDKDFLPGSPNGLVEVVAYNTTRSAAVRLSIGPVDNKPPEVLILSERRLHLRAGQPLYLEAEVIEYQGPVSDDNLVWTNDRGQILGRGDVLELRNGLPVGTHILTLSARDATGAQGQDTIQVIVTPAGAAGTPRLFLPMLSRKR